MILQKQIFPRLTGRVLFEFKYIFPYISFGQPAKAETIDTDGDVLIRVAPDTGEIVGLTILNYSDYLSRIRA